MPHSLVDGDAGVVEDDDDVRLGSADIVECLESLTASERSVADDGNMLALGIALQFGGDGHAESR